jgi:hypothetical protein
MAYDGRKIYLRDISRTNLALYAYDDKEAEV